MISRRALSAAKRRIRDDPRTAAEVVYALVIDDDDGDSVALTASQTVALVWWCRSQGEAYA